MGLYRAVRAMFRGLLLATVLILGVQAYWKPKAKAKSKWYLIETEGESSSQSTWSEKRPKWTTKPPPPPTTWAPKCEYEDEKPTQYCIKYKKFCKDLDVLPKICAKTCKC